jgi:hypothetical protein
MSYDSHSARHRHRGGRQRRHRSGESQSSVTSKKNTPYRSKPPQKQPFLQKLLGFFGLGSKPAPAGGTPVKSGKPVPSRGVKSSSPTAPAREEKPARQSRPPLVHEVTSGRLYVGNLSYDATESDLFELFAGVGKVRNAEIVYHKHNHRSKGYAFVEMAGLEEAKRAVEVLNDNEFMGRKLLVSGARSPHPESESYPKSRPPAEVRSEPVAEANNVEPRVIAEEDANSAGIRA